MRNRGQVAAELLANRDGHDHEWQLQTCVDLEPIVHRFACDCGRERPERFAHLHHRVDAVAHFRAPWIGEHTAMTECARAELHLPAIPRYYVTVGDQFCCLSAEFGEFVKPAYGDRGLAALERFIHFNDRVARAKKRHRRTRVVDSPASAAACSAAPRAVPSSPAAGCA